MFEIPAAILSWFYDLTNSYIIAIALMSVVIMAITTPLTLKSTKGMLEMQKISPEMRRLQNEHRNDKQKLNEEMMKLYQEHKVNPMSSCLPIVAQMPVFIVMFRVLRGLTYAPRGSAEPIADTVFEVVGTSGNIDGFIPRYLSVGSGLFQSLYGKLEMVELGLDLSLSPFEAIQENPVTGIVYALLVVALGGLYFGQQRMVAARASISPTMSPTQQKLMQYLPVVFAVFQVFFLTALVVYYIFQTLLRILQQYYITKKFYGHDESLGRQAQRAGEKAREQSKDAGEPQGLFGQAKRDLMAGKPDPKSSKQSGDGAATNKTVEGPSDRREQAGHATQVTTEREIEACQRRRAERQGSTDTEPQASPSGQRPPTQIQQVVGSTVVGQGPGWEVGEEEALTPRRRGHERDTISRERGRHDMEWVETTAKTVEAAKDAALDRLGVAADEAEFEVVEEPRPGLFGRTRGEARVRARVLPTQLRPKQERRRRGSKDKDRAKPKDRNSSAAGTAADSAADPGAGDAAEAVSTTDAAPAAKGNGRRSSTTQRQDRSSNKSQEKTMSNDEREPSPVSPQEVGDAAVAFMDGLADAFGATASSELHVDGTELEVHMSGEGLGLLVGPGGRTLNAIQDLVRVSSQRRLGDHDTRLRIDVAGYRARRNEALARFAADVALSVRESGSARALEPMTSADRKVIHDALNEEDGVSSRSEGDDPNRRIVVVPD